MTSANLLGIAEHGRIGLRRMLDLAVDRSLFDVKPLAGRGVALIFEKPSNRTRHSMEMAVVQLGGHPVYTRGEEIGFDTRETVEDVTRILSGYHCILAARVFSHEVVRRMAESATVPIVNMLSDVSHPLQALADVLTMESVLGSLEGRTVAWIGDYNNVARSLAEAVCLLGGAISFGCPAGYGPDEDELKRLESLGGRTRSTADPLEAVHHASVIHTDTWVSMGQEDEARQRREIFGPYQVTEKMMAAADPGVYFMHCMPAHRGDEVSAAVFDGPRSLVIQQGHHRLTGARGALAYLDEIDRGGVQ